MPVLEARLGLAAEISQPPVVSKVNGMHLMVALALAIGGDGDAPKVSHLPRHRRKRDKRKNRQPSQFARCSTKNEQRQ